jgi:hypothetical protein
MSGYRPRKKIYRFIYEGNNKTERQFFQHLFSHHSSYVPIDTLPPHPTTDPVSLFQFAEAEVSRLQLQKDLGDRVFIVLDLDHRGDHWRDVARYAQRNKRIVFVPSEPCFEFFFLLHFEDLTDWSLSGDETLARLKKYLQNYDKSMDVFPYLGGSNDIAEKRLRRLWKTHQIKGTLTLADLLDLLTR